MMAARSKSGGQLEASKELGHSSANSPLTPAVAVCLLLAPPPARDPLPRLQRVLSSLQEAATLGPRCSAWYVEPSVPLHPSECVNTDMLYTLWLWSSLKHINARWTASLRWAWALAGEIRAWAASPWVGAV